MKKLLSLGLIVAALSTQAQEEIHVQQKEWALNNAMQPAFVVDVPQTTSKDAIALWEATLVPKNFFDTFKKLPKMEKEDKEQWVIRRVVVAEICPDTLDIYTRITSAKDRITFATLFDNNGSFIGAQSGSDTEKAKEYVRKYATELYRQGVRNEVGELEKELKRMKSDYSGFDRDNKKMDRKSAGKQSDIDELKDELKGSKTILKTNMLSESDNATPLSGEANKTLNEDIKKTSKEIKKAKKSVDKYEKKIDKNTSKQKHLLKDIENKEQEIKKAQEKLENIK